MTDATTTDTAALQRFLDDALGGSADDHRDADGRRRIVRGVRDRPGRRALGPAPRAAAHQRRRARTTCSASSRSSTRSRTSRFAIARPIVACDDPSVFGAPFYVMERIDGSAILHARSRAMGGRPETHGRALEELIDALVAIHAVDWRACGLGDLAHDGEYLPRQITRWSAQLASYESRELPAAHPNRGVARDAAGPPDQPSALCHGDYKLDNVLFAPESPPRLAAVVDWEMAGIGDPLVDLAWALIFHPGPDGTIHLGMTKEPTFAVEHRCPVGPQLVDRYARNVGPRHDRDRLVRRVRALEARDRARRQLRQVPARPVRQADPRVLRDAGRSAARERDEHHRNGATS